MARRLNKDIRARRYGYVKLEGQLYIYLLTRLSSQDSALFAKEVICQSVVRWQTARRVVCEVEGHMHACEVLLLQPFALLCLRIIFAFVGTSQTMP